jgi:hypothetical protein
MRLTEEVEIDKIGRNVERKTMRDGDGRIGSEKEENGKGRESSGIELCVMWWS